MVEQKDWQWFGNVAHFICGQWCRFHLATKVGDYIVSTVGEYVHPRHSQGSEKADAEWWSANFPGEDIGCGRKYETMVFRITGECDCGCGTPRHDGQEQDARGYNDAKSATAGHYEMCQKFAEIN